MIEPLSWLTVIGLIVYLLILGLQWWTRRHDAQQQKTEALDHEIDQAVNADDILRISGELRDKK